MEDQETKYSTTENDNGVTEILEYKTGKPPRKIDPKSEEGRKLLEAWYPDKVAPHTLDPHIKKGHNILDSFVKEEEKVTKDEDQVTDN